ncbi:type 1 glutamine amidotransferase [Paenibacillus radicis (ex Xue et al. 2023)]|uniref:Type 1 glutamine amidotransferase n=1 Tax=Paenibacillus radicis (ex Xue et al. 2023) TaxID=2972489 RepID=A0ABT1YEL1_9BACL|nr:type 1 glutamine amidotransferase [Paenibacillus radicis (ex Xue et al. 2023)]MCR8631637.1 type 1 glutamine amidotransferase [Paenibacillus radicis (ex Xue et al. 2023)]
MRLLILKHFEFDDPAFILSWTEHRQHTASIIYPPDFFTAPSLDSFDFLIILGGPMSAYQDDVYPWLQAEKLFIKSAIDAGKNVLGICLGAQLLAEVMGGKVYRNAHKEIGWHPVTRTGIQHPLFTGVPDTFESFHWHGDCFDIPEDAIPLSYSEACRVQAFAYGEKVLGLQFHLETTPRCMETMLTEWHHEIIKAPYIQSGKQIMDKSYRSNQSFLILGNILDQFEQKTDRKGIAI